MTIEITSKEQFNEEVKRKKIVVLKVYGKGCPACQYLAPRYREMARQYPMVNFLQEDGDLGIHSVQAYPTTFFYVEGKHVDTVVGADDKKILHIIEKFIGFASLPVRRRMQPLYGRPATHNFGGTYETMEKILYRKT